MPIIETLSKILAIISLLCGLLTLVKSPKGVWGGVIWLPKLWASAWAPLLALMGGLGALGGLGSRDYFAVIAGALGAALGIRHTLIVTRQQAGFAQAFGADWEERIPPELKSRLWPKRYRFIQPAPPAAQGTRDVDLGKSGNTDQTLRCDIWEPPQGVPRSGLAVIYFHGGLWQALDKDFLTQPLFRRLTSQGHVIMDVAYSLAPGADLNRMLGDAKQALAWLKIHSRDYGVNPERVVLMGVSGGAHLALMTAYAPDHPAFQVASSPVDMSVRAVISLFGVTDLVAYFGEYRQSNPKQPELSSQITDDLRPHLFNKTWLDRFMTRTRAFPAYRYANMPGGALLLVNLLGGTLEEVPANYRQASPLAHVGRHCPPTLQIHDDNDFVIDASQARRLHQALGKAGVPSIYLEFPDSVHGFDQYFGVSRRVAPAAQSATYDIERFLALMV